MIASLVTDSVTNPVATLVAAERAQRTVAPTEAPARRDSGWFVGEVEVVVHGSTARLRYTTNAPLVEVLVTSYRPQLVDGVWVEPIQACSVGVEFGGGRGTVDVYDHHIQPGITYHYILTVPTTAAERPVQTIGTFTAATRAADPRTPALVTA